MTKLKLILASRISLDKRIALKTLIWIVALWIGVVSQGREAAGRLYIDITSPSMRKIAS